MKLQFGLIGGGNGAFIGDVHRKAALMDDLARLTAGCFTRNEVKNREAAENWGVASDRCYKTYLDMARAEGAREDGIDFVAITTPNDSHYPIAKAFLEVGIHVMCDKPLALSLAEGRELQALAAKKGLLFGVTYTYTGYAMVTQARDIIKNGEIGRIINIVGEYPQEWLQVSMAAESSEQAMWRMDPAKSGPSGCCADIGTHVEAVIHKMTGMSPTRVLARFSHIPPEMPLETNAQVLLDYENGVPGLIWASQISTGHECDVLVRIYGEKGGISWSHLRPWELRVTRLNQPPQIYTCGRDYLSPAASALCRIPSGHPEGFYEAFANIYTGFCRHLLAKKGGATADLYAYPTVENGVQGLAFVKACVESSQNGNLWVAVED